MSNLKSMEDLGRRIAAEDRALEARNIAAGLIPRPTRRKGSTGRTAAFLGRLQARLQLGAVWAARNSASIGRVARNLKSSAFELGGILLIAYGVWTWNPGAGYVVGGIGALVLNWSAQQSHAQKAAQEAVAAPLPASRRL